MSSEIVEEGVTTITVALSIMENRTDVPEGGRVKFFEDELGHTWVKYRWSNGGQRASYDVVLPAWRVVEVRYLKHK